MKMNLENPEMCKALKVVKVLHEKGFLAYFAGGCVRDFLMGEVAHDIDIATNAAPDEIQRLFPKTIAVGKQFGVIIVCLEDGTQFEVATFRCDGQYLDGRRPESVVFSTPEEDAMRRDFTVNGLFYDPIHEKVIDFVEGQADIQRKCIRAIGDAAKRFTEDKLRLLRAIRFSSTLNFQIEETTYQSLCQMTDQIKSVSAERMHDEMVKIFSRKFPEEGLKLLMSTRMLSFICENLADFFKRHETHLKHNLELLSHIKPQTEIEGLATLYYGFFYHSNEKKTQETLVQEWKQLRLSNTVISALAEIFLSVAGFKNFEGMRLGRQIIFVNRKTFDFELRLYQEWLEIAQMDSSGLELILKQSKSFKVDVLEYDAWVDGYDLIHMGFKPGPKMKEILEELYLLQLEGKIANKEDALKKVKDL